MADAKAAIYSWFVAQSSLNALVGTRLYPLLAPATAPLPYITFQRIGEQTEAHLTGLAGLTNAQYQFDVWGKTPAESETVLLAFQQAADMYRGLMSTVPIRQLTITTIIDGLEDPSEGLTQGIWRHTILADLWFHEPL